MHVPHICCPAAPVGSRSSKVAPCPTFLWRSACSVGVGVASMLAACVQGGALALGTPAHQPAPFALITQDCNFLAASRFCAQVFMHWY
jgi:hypothetical protein